MESTPTEQVSSVLHKYYSELVSTVGKHLNGLLVHLVSEGVIKIDDKNTIKKLGDAPSERAEYLLDNHVDRPLSAGITDNFVKLLKVMQKISGCSPLAAKLSEALKCVALSDTSVNSNRRVGDETSKNNQSGIKAFDLEEYRERFSEDDVETSFVYMLSRLEELWSNVEFSKLKNTCKRDRRLSVELRNDLQSTTTLEEMFDLLSDSQFCTWLEIRILKCMAKVADIPEATSMLNIFEECVHSRKCSEVRVHFKKIYINPDHLTLVVAKLNKNAENMIVADLIKYCYKQESILQLPPESITLVNSNTGCLEICVVIPCYCSMYAYEVVKSCFFKLRPLNIQYLQIGTFPKVYTTNMTKATETRSEISSFDDWSNPLQVINHYYTYLEGHMDADSVSHMMHSEHLITDSDYEAITAAPNDITMNCLLLQYVRAMDMPDLLKFCNVLKSIEPQQCIGVNLEISLKSTEYNETAVSQSEYVTTIPSKLMTGQFKEVNTIFLEVIDTLIAQVEAVDIEFLADKCHTLMASDIHNIKLFTDSFIKKLFKCSHSNLFKIYLLPFNTWLDNTILRELATTYKIDTLELFCNFIHIIDDNEPITSYPIPTFSQLIIPLDDSEYTIVAIKMFQNCNELILKDVKDVKEVLELYWELTAHAIQLAAIDYSYNFIYWMIPKQIQPLVENKLSKGQYELWDRGIFLAVLLPNNHFSADNNYDQQVINNPFNVSKPLLRDSIKVCQLNLEDMKICANLLQEENLEKQKQLKNLEDIKVHNDLLQKENFELNSQLEKQLENSEDYSRWKSQLQHTVTLQEENFTLKTQLKVMRKIVRNSDDMKIHTNILQEENSELKGQLELTQQQLKNLDLEKKEKCDISIQTDMVKSSSVIAGLRDILQNLQSEITLTIQLPYLLPILRQKHVVTETESQQLSSDERESESEKNGKLIRIIMRKGEDAFDLFVEALQEEQQHFGHSSLAKRLLREKILLKAESKPQPPPRPYS